MTEDRFIAFVEAPAFVNVKSTRTLRRYIKRGVLPQPIRYSKRNQGWMLSTLIAARDRLIAEAAAK